MLGYDVLLRDLACASRTQDSLSLVFILRWIFFAFVLLIGENGVTLVIV